MMRFVYIFSGIFFVVMGIVSAIALNFDYSLLCIIFANQMWIMDDLRERLKRT